MSSTLNIASFKECLEHERQVVFLTPYLERSGEAESSLLKSEKVLQQYQSRFDGQEEEQSLAMQIAWARGRC